MDITELKRAMTLDLGRMLPGGHYGVRRIRLENDRLLLDIVRYRGEGKRKRLEQAVLKIAIEASGKGWSVAAEFVGSLRRRGSLAFEERDPDVVAEMLASALLHWPKASVGGVAKYKGTQRPQKKR